MLSQPREVGGVDTTQIMKGGSVVHQNSADRNQNFLVRSDRVKPTSILLFAARSPSGPAKRAWSHGNCLLMLNLRCALKKKKKKKRKENHIKSKFWLKELNALPKLLLNWTKQRDTSLSHTRQRSQRAGAESVIRGAEL